MSDNRFVQIKFENFHLAMEARIYQTTEVVFNGNGPTRDRTLFEVWFYPGLEGERWTKHIALTFHDAMTLVADLSVSARHEFPAA